VVKGRKESRKRTLGKKKREGNSRNFWKAEKG